MLDSDYVLQTAANLLEKGTCGKVRLDLICEGSLNDDPLKRRLLSLIQPNLQTLRHLLQCNRTDFPLRSPSVDRPRIGVESVGGMLLRRAKAVRLVEETPLRRQHLQTVLAKLEKISRQMDSLLRDLISLRSAARMSAGRKCGKSSARSSA